MIESIGRGVLDTRIRGYDGLVRSRHLHVTACDKREAFALSPASNTPAKPRSIHTRGPGTRVVVKVGTLDNSSLFDGPKIAIHTVDMQPCHHAPEGMPAFERLPQR